MSVETIELLLAITSGIMSLVGLISIFISMNSQHNVQHSREILWNIFTLPYKKDIFLDKGAIGQEIFRKFILYEQITNEKNIFLKNVITFSQMALAFAGLSWIAIVFSLFRKSLGAVDQFALLLGLFAAICFLLYFIFAILNDLKSIRKVGQLPTIEELLDANLLKYNSNVITLAAVSSRLKIINSDIYLGFPIPFTNLRVKISVQNSMKTESNSMNFNSRLSLTNHIKEFQKLNNQKFKLLDDDYCYYKVTQLQNLEEQRNSFIITVDFMSKQGIIASEYYCEGIINHNDTKLIIYPHSFTERFVNRKSELDPLRRYMKRESPLSRETEWTSAYKTFLTLLD